MSWFSNIPPGIKNIFRRDEETGETLWVKCPGCGEMLFERDLDLGDRVCGSCQYHFPIEPQRRFEMTFDGGAFEPIALPDPVADPLKFRDTKRYVDRLKEYRRKTGQRDAMIAASGHIDGVEAVITVQDFRFMGGSMGMALGEAMIRAAEEAVARRAPLIVFAASGGARMQEGALSLMQMPRTTIAVEMVKEAGLLFIVVLTHPTTGGVTASYAMLGDVHLAEPGALIGFAGPRVIEQTIREKLPEGFQRSEFLAEKGMVDLVCPRGELKPAIGRLVRTLRKASATDAVDVVVAAGEASREPEPPANDAAAEDATGVAAIGATGGATKGASGGATGGATGGARDEGDGGEENAPALDKAAE